MMMMNMRGCGKDAVAPVQLIWKQPLLRRGAVQHPRLKVQQLWMIIGIALSINIVCILILWSDHHHHPQQHHQHQSAASSSRTVQSTATKSSRLLLQQQQQRPHRSTETTRLKRRTTAIAQVVADTMTTTTTSTETATTMSFVTKPPPPPKPLPHPIRLLRIPKAGSSSFSAFLRLQYNCIDNNYPPGDCTRHNQHVCPAIQGCSNHAPIPAWQEWYNHNNNNNTITTTHTKTTMTTKRRAKSVSSSSSQEVPVIMVTMVRDPIARYYSAYKYPGHHGMGTRGNITAHTLYFPEYANVQTNYLSRHAIGTWDIYNGNQPRSTIPPSTVSQSEWQHRLEDAIALLRTEYLSFVGILEYWNDSLRLFCRMYQCTTNVQNALNAPIQRQSTATIARTMKKKKKKTATQSEINAVMAANAIDQQLYQAAIQRFCQDIQRHQQDTTFMAQLERKTIALCFAP